MVLKEPEPGFCLKNLVFTKETKMVHNVNQVKSKKSVFTKEEQPSCEDRWDHHLKPLEMRGFLFRMTKFNQ